MKTYRMTLEITKPCAVCGKPSTRRFMVTGHGETGILALEDWIAKTERIKTHETIRHKACRIRELQERYQEL